MMIIWSQAYWDVIRGYGWKSFTILYQDEKSLVRLQDLLRVSTITGYKVTIRQLTQSEDYRCTQYANYTILS